MAQTRNAGKLAVVVLLGLLATAALIWTSGDRFFHGLNDFFALYPGGPLAFDPHLYDKATEDRVQEESAHGFSDGMTFIRLPFYGVMLWPLGRLAYLPAYTIFLTLTFASFVGFILWWRPPDPAVTLEGAALFLPALVSFVNGQDVLFLVLIVALVVRLEASGKRIAAGMLLSLGAIKIHIFVLTPLLILAGGFWAIGAGFLLGGAILLAVSFAAQGWNWPWNFYHLFTEAVVNPHIGYMPNLHNLCHQLPFATIWQLVLSAAVIAGAWFAVRRSTFLRGFAVILCAGLLIGHHSYMADCSLLLPVFLSGRSMSSWPLLRTASDLFLKPFLYVLLFIPAPIFPLLLLGYYAMLAYAPWQEEKLAREPLVSLRAPTEIEALSS